MPIFLRPRRRPRPRARFIPSAPAAASQTLTGAIPAAVWSVAAVALVTGAVTLSGASPAATWAVSPSLTLTASGAGVLQITAPAFATWRASTRSLTGGAPLGGGGDQAQVRLGLEQGVDTQTTPRLGGGSIL